MIAYEQINSLPEDYIKKKLKDFFEEDFPYGDITTNSVLPNDSVSTAYIQAEEDIITAGLDIIKFFFDKEAKIEILFTEGAKAQKGDIIARITTDSKELLTKERSLLNLLQRLCGIATLTRRYVDLAKPFGVKILDTRKTMPGLRLFDKYAVHCGGGTNHRLNLSDGILIKDNHITAAGGVKEAVTQIKALVKTLKLELEVDTSVQLAEGLESGIDGVLLDNMPPEAIRTAVEFIRNHPKGKDILIEASGGINLDNITGYLDTGINAISVGALTHSVKNSNIHMEFE